MGLLIGRFNILRVDVPESMMSKKGIDLDDWKKSITILSTAVDKAFSDFGNKIKDNFLIETIICNFKSQEQLFCVYRYF